MGERQHKRLEELFDAAVGLPREKRSAYLRRECDDDRLRHDVEALLARDADDSTRAPLATPAVAVAIGEPVSEPAAGAVLAERYRLVRQLGAGGMGVVWLAEQLEPEREVALKLIRPGVASRELLNRFRYEAAVLARLKHPGIAQIYETGMYDDGAGAQGTPTAIHRGWGPRPFFAMELVEGEPLDRYLAAHDFTLRARLNVMMRICDAVQYAHQKGVIHRDLKPANILIDATGQPKVLDFGVARLIDSEAQLTTIRTDVGRLIGTLAYMSPEQVAADDGRLDTRSDVYALGVLLYELLAARLPYDLRDRPVAQAIRIVSEAEPVPLSSVSRLYRGDLNTIVLKALEKDPERRYQSAAELSADIHRHLDSKPIAARPATTFYQFRKFAKRNKVLVGSVAAIVTVLATASVGTGLALVDARQSASRQRAVSDFMENLLSAADPATGRADVRFVEVLHDGADNAAALFEDHPEVEDDVRLVLGTAFSNLTMYEEAVVHLSRAHEIRLAQLGPGHPDTRFAASKLSWPLFNLRRGDEAVELVEEILVNTPPGELDGITALDGRRLRADAMAIRGEFEPALSELRRVRDAALRVHGPDHPVSLLAAESLGHCLYLCVAQKQSDDPEGDLKRASELRSEALRGYTELHGASSYLAIDAMASLAETMRVLGRFDEAATLASRVLELGPPRFGEDHNICASARKVLSRVRFVQGRFEESAELRIAAVESTERREGVGSIRALASMSDGLPVLHLAGRAKTGERFARALYERFSSGGHGSALAARYLADLARFLSRQGRFDEAEEIFEEVLNVREELSPTVRSGVEICYAGHLIERERYEEAEPLLLNSYEHFAADPTNGFAVHARYELARLYELTARPELAEQWRSPNPADAR